MRCLLLLQGKGVMRTHKAAIPLVMRGSVGRHQVHAKGSDEGMRLRLEKQQNGLAFELGISAGEQVRLCEAERLFH